MNAYSLPRILPGDCNIYTQDKGGASRAWYATCPHVSTPDCLNSHPSYSDCFSMDNMDNSIETFYGLVTIMSDLGKPNCFVPHKTSNYQGVLIDEMHSFPAMRL